MRSFVIFATVLSQLAQVPGDLQEREAIAALKKRASRITFKVDHQVVGRPVVSIDAC
jgi:hypothetical protein